jgi:hypothetical protein
MAAITLKEYIAFEGSIFLQILETTCSITQDQIPEDWNPEL